MTKQNTTKEIIVLTDFKGYKIPEATDKFNKRKIVQWANRRLCTRPDGCPYDDGDKRCTKFGRCDWKGTKGK